MARVRVKWREITTYDQVLEIEDFDPKDQDWGQIEDAIVEQANWMHVEGVADRNIISTVVLP